MGKELSPVAAALIIALFIFLGTPIYLTYEAATELPRITHLHQSPNGHVFVLLGDELYEYDNTLNHYQTIDLESFGLNSRIGDFGFFSNGDVLIHQGKDNRGWLFKIQRFLRLDNQTPPVASNNATGLVRCQLDSMTCETFGNPPLNLNDAYHLFVDWTDDHVFLTDSSRHTIKELSPEGTLLNRITESLKFPNHLIFSKNSLYVANTNHHEISIYKRENDKFKFQSTKSFRTDRTPFSSPIKRWPASLLLLQDEIWVINYESDMSNGEIIRFDLDGNTTDRIDVPSDADPFSMLLINNEILISDYHHNRIYRYNPQGKRLDDMDAGPLYERIGEYTQQRSSYSSWMWFFIGLFVFALTVGLIIGIRQSIASYQAPPKPSLTDQALNLNTADIIWLEPGEKFKRLAKTSRWSFAILALVFIPLAITAYEISYVLILFPLSLLPLLIMIYKSMHALTSQRIGVMGEKVILNKGTKHFAVGKGKSIYYCHNQVGIDELIVTLRTNQPIFDEKQLVNFLYPRLKEATNISAQQMLWERVKSNPKALLFWVLATIPLGAFYLALKNNWIV